jgi:hypothetical protein
MLQLENKSGTRSRHVAKPTQGKTDTSRGALLLFPHTKEFFAAASIRRQINLVRADLHRNSAEFRAHFPRKYSQSSRLMKFAPEARGVSNKKWREVGARMSE